MNTNNDDDDAKTFREAMKGVRPLKGGGRAATAAPPPSPRPRQREADDAAVLREMMDGPLTDVGEELSYRGEGLQDAAFKKLRRGTYRIGRELDLHGLRAGEAKLAVAQFIAECRDGGERCVRIIHGKGLRSKGDGPVLKQRIDGWLRRHRDVLAFCSARPEHGGTGAVYVLLRAAPG
ncbi:MAG TPA: Smr/MutS family protein [Verrucomicrobiae bacterium]|nr:Smr/MutS family protein [Verrucomicrobiae bacterium]